MMPIHEIQVKEYECIHCGHKWINYDRVKGKDAPMPKKCAKCKRMNWNGKGEGSNYDPILPNERSLRVKLYKYEGYLNEYKGVEGTQYRPNELCSVFLNLNPRPNIVELHKALHPIPGYSSYKHRHNHFIPDADPDRPHYPDQINLKRGVKNEPFLKSGYVKTLIQETVLRREYMKKVIESRGQTVPNNTEKQFPAFFLTMWGHLL
jgi:hypothetical protein